MYPISVDHGPNRGILNKMEDQWAAFSELTGNVDLMCNSVRGPILNGELHGQYRVTGRGFDSLNHYGAFFARVARQVKSSAYDYLYIRYPLAIPSFLWFLRTAKAALPKVTTVVEIATFPYRGELRTPKRLVLRSFDDLGRGRLARYVDAIVTFYGQPEIYGIPCFALCNGVDVARIPLRSPRTDDGELSLIAVGNVAERHGLDRVLCGMANYAHTPDATPATLQVVGDGPAVAGLVELSEKLGVAERVRFHGMKSGAELDALFDAADVAFDSLAIHRLSLPGSSSLKAREYCARGIPFVLASDDADFPPELDFVHCIPSDESALDVSALVSFHEQLRRTHSEVHREMRRHAEKNLTWKTKLEPLADYLRERADRSMS